MAKRIDNNKSIEAELFLKKLEDICVGIKRFDKQVKDFKNDLLLNKPGEFLLENNDEEGSLAPLKK